MKFFFFFLIESGNYFKSLNIINYEASIINDCVVGKKSPTTICLPVHQPKVEFIYQFWNYDEAPTSKQSGHNRKSSR